jgi:hypothetical protein
MKQLGRRPLNCAVRAVRRLHAHSGVQALDGSTHFGDDIRREHDVQVLQVAVGDEALVEILDRRCYFPRVSEAKMHGRGGHPAQHLVQAAAAHPLHDVHGVCAIVADAVGVARAGTDSEFVDEFVEVALSE